MNERQRDFFLYEWDRRRRRGRIAIALMGGAIGAAGGLAFTLLMFGIPAMAGQSLGEIDTSDMAPFLGALARLLGPVGFMLALAVPAFAVLGLAAADRIFSLQERQYHHFLAQGARVPETRPAWTMRDRLPLLIVLGVGAAIAVFLIFMVFWELNRGTL